MRYENSSPLRFSTLGGNVCVAEGFATRVFVRHGRLHVRDGFGQERRERVYARVQPGITRLVMLGHAGSFTLEALRWLSDLGIGFAQIDSDGRLVATSSAGPSDAPLRRAQATAAFTETGVEVARGLLRKKLDGQRKVLGSLPATPTGQAEFEEASERLDAATAINELVQAEQDAALAYWQAWRAVEIRFRKSDRAALPEHWTRFGRRGSPLTSAPRLAINPANALLNYLYAILEAETRIACLALGLDPSLGIVHADFRARDSLALDLMEAVRPQVDEYVLALLRQRTFKRSDFHETRRGVCRILSPLTHDLAETANSWAQLIAPVAEDVAKTLADAPGSRVQRLSTPLTNRKRRNGRDTNRRADRPASTPSAQLPSFPPGCRGCGDGVPHPERVYCNDCLPAYERDQFDAFSGTGLAAIERAKAEGHDPTHGGEAAKRRGKSTANRKREISEWEREYGRLTDLEVFRSKILPGIQGVPLSRLVRATGLSLRYCSQIRRGEKIPHPRHWQGFRGASRASK